MKRFVFAALIACAALLIGVAPAAHADDLVDQAVKGLSSSKVFVSPANPDLKTRLQQSLTSDDGIVLVVLPENSVSEPIDDAVRRIDANTEGRYIIGLAIGTQVRGFSSFLPDNTADDLMSRANSVASSPAEALTTFTRMVHEWQRAHPEPVPKTPKSDPAPASSSHRVIPTLIVVAIALSILVTSVAFVLKRVRRQSSDAEYYQSTPEAIGNELRAIMSLRSQANDNRMQTAIAQACADTEEFFKRAQNKDASDDISMVKSQLVDIHNIVKRYIDIQDNPRFYAGDQHTLLTQGRDAIVGYDDAVVHAIQIGNVGELTKFQLNTEILSAQQTS